MKEGLQILAVIIIAAWVVTYVAITLPKSTAEGGRYQPLSVVDLDGHQYVLLNGVRKAAVVHHQGCPCLDAKEMSQ